MSLLGESCSEKLSVNPLLKSYGRVETLDFALTLGLFAGETKCFEVSTPSARATFGPLPSSGTLVCRLPSVPLLDGSYFVNCGVYPPSWDYVYDHHWQMHTLSNHGEGAPTQVSGLVSVEPAWSLTG